MAGDVEKIKRPAFQFYPADWRKDVGLQSCSMAAQGLWINVLCIAHQCEPYGHLTINGRPMTNAQIGRQIGGLSEAEAGALLQELLDAGVASRADDGAVFSRRMVRDEDLRNRRADGGKSGAEFGHLGAEHGAKGGRPRKGTGDKKPPSDPPLAPPINPPPSSSSSTSVPSSLRSEGEATSAELTPTYQQTKTKRAKVTLAAYLESCKVAGVKPVPDGHNVKRWAADAGLTTEMLQVCWVQFRERYLDNSEYRGKKYTEWPDTFSNCVKGNWFGLWFMGDDGCPAWTSKGLIHKAALDTKQNREAEHA